MKFAVLVTATSHFILAEPCGWFFCAHDVKGLLKSWTFVKLSKKKKFLFYLTE